MWLFSQRSGKEQSAPSPTPAITQSPQTPTASPGPTPSGPITWTYLDTARGWQPSPGSTPPACPEPLALQNPVDISKVTSLLWPGQYRGTHFKAHGGFRFDSSKVSDISVTLPLDAYLTDAVRYIESGELQYLLTFQNPCGIMVRFDHLYELTPAFAAILETTPEARVDDTRSLPLSNPTWFTAGTVVATGVGHTKPLNVGVDFGVYDLRNPNEISKNAAWAALHENEASQNFYGLCWLGLLPTESSTALLSLPSKTDDRGASDYCAQAPGGSTLKYNNGKPAR